MFGIFKKQNPLHRADCEIESIALMAIEEGQLFADKVIWKFPIDYDKNQLSFFLQKRDLESKNMLVKDFVKQCKMSFEFSWLISEYANRYFCSAGLKEIGVYIYDRITDRMFDIYTESFWTFLEADKSEVRRFLFNQVNERAMKYAKLNLFSSENKEHLKISTVCEAVAERICLIDVSAPNNAILSNLNEEYFRVLTHLIKSANNDKFSEGFSNIKNKLASTN